MKLVERLKLGIVTAGFLGLAPLAPGTFGTLGGVAIAYALRATTPYWAWILVSAVLLYFVGRALAPWAERNSGKDPQFFVLDEVVGFLVTVAWIRPPSLLTLGVGFLLFRLFDVWKPAPIHRLEQLPAGDGIMADDVMAGIYAFGVLLVLRLAFPGTELNPWEWAPAS